MRVSVPIIQIGHSMGFAIPDKAHDELQLQVGSDILVETECVVEGQHTVQIKVYLRGKVVKSGGKNGGFIIGAAFIPALGLNKGSVLNVDITKE